MHRSLLARLSGRPLALAPRALDGLLADLRHALHDVELRSASPFAITDAGIAVVPIIGPLVSRGDMLTAFLGVMDYGEVGDAIEAAFAEPSARAVLLEVDSPGGEVGGLFDLVDRIAALRDAAGKPLWAVASESALSAAYAIASVADRLYVTRTAEVGSVGVVAAHVDESGADAKAGLKWTLIHAGARKIDGNAHAPLSDRAFADIQADVDALHAELVALVAGNRNMTPEAVRATEAAIFRGRRGIEVGFADRLGTVDQALADLTATLDPPSRPMGAPRGARILQPSRSKPAMTIDTSTEATVEETAATETETPTPAEASPSTPPVPEIPPETPAALAYLRDVTLDLLGRVAAAGGELAFQIGEPWWWDGSFGSQAPHIYDATTMAAYSAATGGSVPEPKLTSIFGQPAAQHLPYIGWCRDQLGAATDWLVSEIRAVFPQAVSHILLFSPQLLREGAPLLKMLNLPVEDWKFPAFDILEIEEYDRVIEGDFAFSRKTWGLATAILGYPKDRIHYFAGFNLLAATTWTWFNIDQAIWRAFAQAPAEVFVWSREQAMRDGWLYDRQSWKLYPGLTHLATCWRIARTDGVVLGFTSHDRPLVIDGVTYTPANGFTASALASDTEMAAADAEMLGAIDADEITATDLLAGLYDHAEVELFLVDWSDLTIPKTILRRGTIGTISQSDASFTAELRGLAQRIQQPVIESYSPECRVDLFSPECGIDREAFQIFGSVSAVTDGTLGAVSDNRVFFTADLNQEDGWFDYGELLWLTGANAGRVTEIRTWTAPAVGPEGVPIAGRIELWEPMGRDIAVGDSFRIWPGCDKRLSTCRDKFANVINFRGEPHVPGTDAMLRIPDPKA